MGAAVVVIDDDDDIAMLLLAGLRRAEVAAVRASDGDEGVRLVQSERPRVVLMDWMMPVKDGVQACREIRSDQGIAQPHIIMLTARTHPDDLELALQAGIDEVITKPFRVREVASRVTERLSRN